MLTRDAVLDFDLIGQIRARVPVAAPLVLHGSSGVPDASLARAIMAGMTKINIATQPNKVVTAAVRERLDADERLGGPREYRAPGPGAAAAAGPPLAPVL